jgi:glutamate-1-semialdehyde 2,1-aminomutase
VATLSIPGTSGVPRGAISDTTVLPYNDISSLSSLSTDDLAGIIVEPLAANMGVVPPADGFLEALRASCDRTGALLIFDEVISGFRVGLGGMQERAGVMPDLTCLGKVIGGGLPIGAVAGRAGVMQHLAPAGSVYQAGTLSGNPVAVAAGLAVLHALVEDPPYARLEEVATTLERALTEAAARVGIPLTVNREASIFSAFFAAEHVTDHAGARAQDTDAFARFFHALLDRGVNIAPGAFEAWFLSSAHSDDDIERTIDAIEPALEAAAR